ncbi:choline monooxygenase, chloroplastic [Dorcoceras hygrometricum]|uniref:Choline monooxygenase, chloroplastic n=1 Tax=Dorcoceras hygrometricum TaxID=472368 RepID=A0A2Z7CTQ7_9LAMI|nr:choline monooxygenase, chloroplastic [Dorcoceras hygrometricum]
MAATMMIQKLPTFHQSAQILPKPRTHFEFVKKRINKSQSNEIFVRRCGDRGDYLQRNCVEEINDVHGRARRLVQEFDPRIPIEEAWTPPSCWYTDPDFYALELQQVFRKGWHPVELKPTSEDNQKKTLRGNRKPYNFSVVVSSDSITSRQNHVSSDSDHEDELQRSALSSTASLTSYFLSLGSIEYVVCRDEKGMLNAFHNVCRHHASLLVSGTGKKPCFVCPYHGWTYGLNGGLMKATRITGIKNFKVNEMGLVPLEVAIWGPFVLINFSKGMRHEEDVDNEAVGNEWLGSTADILSNNGVDTSLDYICRRTYTIECNWKILIFLCIVIVGNLYDSLPLTTKMYEKVSIQSCEGCAADNEEFVRLGSKALYAFVYPNFMINRYGPWMDTNLVLPLGPRRCKVVFDYFLDASLKDDVAFIEKSLEDSERVQLEDITLSEAVQRGLESPAYNVGRYSPTVEMAMHHFHCLLQENLRN